MARVLGIDPGASGAVALVESGKLVTVADMPCELAPKRQSGKAAKRLVDACGLAELVRKLGQAGAIDFAMVEHVGSMPHDGHVGAFTFGRAAGIVLGVLAGLGVVTDSVAPGIWKHRLGVTADKRTSLQRARGLWPAHAGLFARAKDDGRAEAALIGLYGDMLRAARAGSGTLW
jgi:crossover junction endodeoxyribonuclease RuvC